MAAAGVRRIDRHASTHVLDDISTNIHIQTFPDSIMAAVHPAVPTENASSMATPSGVDKDALISRLDALLEQYLLTLDSYEQLMQQLSKQLSSVLLTPSQS